MSACSRLSRLVWPLVLVALAAGCRHGGPAATGGIGHEKKDRGKLRARNTQEHMRDYGGNIRRWILYYEGGPKESWAFQTWGGPPEELEGKDAYSNEDDADVELLEPQNGAPRVPLEVPAFCDNYSGAGLRLSFDGMHHNFLENGDPGVILDNLSLVAWAACDRSHYEPRQKRVQRLLQTFENETKMPLAELEELLAALAASKIGADFCGSDPIQRWISCGEAPDKDKSEDTYSFSTLDRMEMDGKPMDAERFRLAMSSFVWVKKQDIEYVHVPVKDAYHLGGSWLSIEPAVFRSEGYSPDSVRQMFAKAAVNAVEARMIEWDTLGLTILAKEKSPAAKYLFQRQFNRHRKAIEDSIASLGDRVNKAKEIEDKWRKEVFEPNKEGIKAAFTALRSPSSKEACATADASFVAAITAKAPKSWKAATELLADPAIDLFAQARQKCHEAGGDKAVAEYENRLFDGWGRRSMGPRVTAYRDLNEWPDRYKRLGSLPARTVKSTGAKDDAVEVRFEPEEWLEERESCRETNKIDGITWEGKIEYRVECTSLPPIKHRDPLPPVTLPKTVASGLKKGHVIQLVEEQGKVPFVATDYPSKKAADADTDLAMFLGIVLKH